MSILQDFQAALEAEADMLTPEQAVTVLVRLYGGSRPYIPQRKPRPPSTPETRRLTPRQVERQFGVSSSTAHRWTCTWRRQ